MPGADPQADPFQQFQRLAAGVGLAGQLQRQHDVFQRGQSGQQLEGLEHETDSSRPQQGAAILVQAAEIDPRQPYPPLARHIQARQQPQQGRFAGTGGADHRHAFALADGEVDVVEDEQRTFRADDLLAQPLGPHDTAGGLVVHWRRGGYAYSAGRFQVMIHAHCQVLR